MGGPKTPKVGSELATWKSRNWQVEVDALRQILQGCGLDEVIKWRAPCYRLEGKNIVIIQEMKSFLALMFFKGALLEDAKGILKKPGEQSNAARRFEFTAVDDILDAAAVIESYVAEAVEIEKAGLKVKKPDKKLDFPKELLSRFEKQPSFKAAFEALTPGRQRGYNIYFSAPKSAEARERRIDKYAQKILDGKGFHDR